MRVTRLGVLQHGTGDDGSIESTVDSGDTVLAYGGIDIYSSHGGVL